MNSDFQTIAIHETADNIISQKDLQKMKFIYNALDNGWQIIKKTDTYVFTKKHNGQREVFREDYLAEFVTNNLDNN